MLKLHFGGEILVDIVGMDTGEQYDKSLYLNKYDSKQFDIVYHGASIIPILLQLAEILSEYSFFVLTPFQPSELFINHQFPIMLHV